MLDQYTENNFLVYWCGFRGFSLSTNTKCVRCAETYWLEYVKKIYKYRGICTYLRRAGASVSNGDMLHGTTADTCYTAASSGTSYKERMVSWIRMISKSLIILVEKCIRRLFNVSCYTKFRLHNFQITVRSLCSSHYKTCCPFQFKLQKQLMPATHTCKRTGNYKQKANDSKTGFQSGGIQAVWFTCTGKKKKIHRKSSPKRHDISCVSTSNNVWFSLVQTVPLQWSELNNLDV